MAFEPVEWEEGRTLSIKAVAIFTTKIDVPAAVEAVRKLHLIRESITDRPSLDHILDIFGLAIGEGLSQDYFERTGNLPLAHPDLTDTLLDGASMHKLYMNEEAIGAIYLSKP
jgi:hypothetical protein